MANNTITFDPAAGVSYSTNLTINTGANFKSTFKVVKPDKSAFNFTGYSGSSQMVSLLQLVLLIQLQHHLQWDLLVLLVVN